jgi:GLPGLI family protein
LKFLSYRYLAFSLVLITNVSCKKILHKTESEQGTIIYQINYIDNGVGNYSESILPHRMESRFKDDMVKNSIEGALGFFSLVNISDHNEMTNTTLLKFIDKKYVYRGKRKELPCCFMGLEGMEIEFTDSTKRIINFTCNEAIVTFPGTNRKSFAVYYTTEINFNDPNALSPFKDIPGILMEFHATLGGTSVKIVAEKYVPGKIPDKEFSLPKNYKEIDKEELENIMSALLSNNTFTN